MERLKASIISLLFLTLIQVVFCRELSPLIAHEKLFKYDLVICALFRNEELYIKEWIEFHKLMGIQHFYLYDNGSTDRSVEILQPYIDAQLVDLFSWPLETNNQKENLYLLQLPIYRDALKIVKRTARWAAFIDLDEFLFPVQANNLIDLLQHYSQYGGLTVNWQIFGTSNRDHLHPNELLIEALTWKGPVHAKNHHYVKSIVQPCYVKKIEDPHSFHFMKGFFAVNTNGELMVPGIGVQQSIVIDKIRINHYQFGTRNWFLTRKVPLKLKWGHINNASPEYLDDLMARYNVEYDDSIACFIPALRAAMQRAND